MADVGNGVIAAFSAARSALDARASEVNDLNVFPVADGDTGTNLLLTIRAVEQAALALTTRGLSDRCEEIARAALLGAKGNSGMILSQIVRGAADVIADATTLDGPTAAQALRGASDAAYRAVRHPVEGTMLTIARKMADAAEAADDPSFIGTLQAAITGGRVALAETTDQLDVLREAGVVDSGAYGVLVILEGFVAGLEGKAIAAAIEARPAAPAAASADDHPPSEFRYCTSYLVEGATIEMEELERRLEPLGDSLLVLGDRRQAKIHLHTDDPDRAIGIGRDIGTVSAETVDDMHRQERERAARLARRAGTATPVGGVDPDLRLDAANTAIVTDSGSDLRGGARPEGLTVVPLTINFGDDSFRDGEQIATVEFYERLAASKSTPTTAQPAIGELIETYRTLLQTHEFVVSLHISTKLSGTANTARAAAVEVDPKRIAIVETASVSFQLGFLVRRVAALIEGGTTVRELEAFVERFRATNVTVFSLETIEFLRKGGRVGPAKALLGSLLGVLPVLEISDGEVHPIGKVRGKGRMLGALGKELERRSDPNAPLSVALGHSARPEHVAALEELVRRVRPRATIDLVYEIGPTVGTHAGPGTLALAFVPD